MTPPAVEAVEAVLRAYRDIGVRAAVAPLVFDVDDTGRLAEKLGFDLRGALFTDVAGVLPVSELQAQLEELLRRWHGAEGGRLQVFAGRAARSGAATSSLSDWRRPRRGTNPACTSTSLRARCRRTSAA